MHSRNDIWDRPTYIQNRWERVEEIEKIQLNLISMKIILNYFISKSSSSYLPSILWARALRPL